MNEYKNKNRRKERFPVIKTIETIVLTILIMSFIVLIYCVYVSIKNDNVRTDDEYKSESLSQEVATNTINDNISNIDMINNVSNAVVGISTIKNKGTTVFLTDGTTSLNLGTGFIVSEDGYIITNEHVSGDKYSTCYVTLINGKSYTGNVVWADTEIDISIVKVTANNVDYVKIGDSDSLKVAQEVYAIGNPIGYEFQRTVTSGIISGLDRTVKIEQNNTSTYMEDLIQTDATINPGNSGGPLINVNGEIIGINSVKITSAEGIGFAYPINVIKPIIESLKNGEEYVTATLGISAYDKNVIPYINQELGLNRTLNNGIYVAAVTKNSPAENAGIAEGDILVSVDDKELNKMSELRTYIYSKSPGDVIKIKYIRSNKEIDTTATLTKK